MVQVHGKWTTRLFTQLDNEGKPLESTNWDTGKGKDKIGQWRWVSLEGRKGGNLLSSVHTELG